MPTFVPFVVADTGELGQEAATLIDFLVAKYKKHVRGKVRTDGLTTKELVSEFRNRLKLSVQFAIASGLGAMVAAAGQPWHGFGM